MKAGVSFTQKVKDKVKMAGRKLASKTVSGMMQYVKNNPEKLSELRVKHGYTKEQIIYLDIISEDKSKSYVSDKLVFRKMD